MRIGRFLLCTSDFKNDFIVIHGDQTNMTIFIQPFEGSFDRCDTLRCCCGQSGQPDYSMGDLNLIFYQTNQALQEVRRLLNANKAGHTGALDPLATGLLPLCFGEATKVSSLMLDDNKRYQVTIRLGIMTDLGTLGGATSAARFIFAAAASV